MSKKIVRSTKKRTASSHASARALRDFLVQVEKADLILTEESQGFHGLLPESNHVIKAARRMGNEFDGDVVRQQTQLARNVVRVASFKAGGEPAAVLCAKMINETFDMVESLAVRSAYMVGLSRGFKVALEMEDAAKQRSAGGAR